MQGKLCGSFEIGGADIHCMLVLNQPKKQSGGSSVPGSATRPYDSAVVPKSGSIKGPYWLFLVLPLSSQ